MDNLIQRYLALQQQVAAAKARSPRSAAHVQLVAVSKRQPAAAMKTLEEYLSRSGDPAVFGENTVQEFDKKRSELGGQSSVHFIGHLQSNKVKRAVELFDVIESVSSAKLVALVSREAAKLNKVQKIFLQVNISEDEAKGGFSETDVERFLCAEFARNTNVLLCGLMTITRYYEVAEDVRPDYARFRALRDRLLQRNEVQALLQGRTLLLSMGMSHDFEIAVEEGADLVRIGTALFGERE